AHQLQGKELSYNNVADTDAAYELDAEFDPDEAPACVIVKHANPCGVAVGETLEEGHRRALECEPGSGYGGIIAGHRELDGAAARKIVEMFTEVAIAREFAPEAAEICASRRNLRLLAAGGLPDPRAPGEVFRSTAGGFLVQSRDISRITAKDLKVVTKRK